MIGVLGKDFFTIKRILLDLPSFEDYRRTGNYNVLINVGLQKEKIEQILSPSHQDIPILNKALVLDKYVQNRLFSEKGIPAPKSFLEMPETEYPLLIKRRFSQGGIGIELIQDERLIRPGQYFQVLKNKQREFRAHVAIWYSPAVFTLQEKLPKESNEPNITWNIASGFYFHRSFVLEDARERCNRFPLFKRISKVALKAIKALKYDFGAVDIIMDSNRDLWVLEVNSHPKIKNPTSVDQYKKVFGNIGG